MTKEQGVQLQQQLGLNPHLKIVHCGDDEILVKHGGRSLFSRVIRDEGRTKLVGKILRNMVLPTTLAKLLEENIIKKEELEDAVKLVDYLQEEQVLIDPSQDFTRVYLETILGGETALSSRTVGVVGAGYLGARTARELARLGVGKLVVLDDRQIESERIDRLNLDLIPSVVKKGRPYVECLQQHLEMLEYDNIKTIKAPFGDTTKLREVAEEADFLIAALEIFSSNTLHTVNLIAIESEKPWISAYIDGSEACIGPLYVPGETCCYNEFEIQHEAAMGKLVRDNYLTYKEALDEGEINIACPVLSPYLSITSGLAATGVMRFLVSGRAYLVGRCIRIDFERLSVDYEEVLRLPRCPACTQHPSYRHLFL